MENPTAFDLNYAIRCWRGGLRQSPHFREENLAELEAHLRDSVAELQGRGLTDEEAFLLATRRLGNSARLDSEFAKVNRGQVWLNRVLWMLVGIQVSGLLGTIAHLASAAAVLGGLTGLGYKFQNGSMPYSGNLFPAAIFGLSNLLVLAACITGCCWFVLRKEDTANRAVVKALRRPILLGVVASVLFLAVTLCTFAATPLMLRCFSVQAYVNVAMAQSLAGFVLWPLQTLALVVLTIVLCRRRLRLSTAW
jgi:hypothetical protein